MCVRARVRALCVCVRARVRAFSHIMFHIVICCCILHILYLQHIFMYSLSLPISCALYIFLPLGLRGIFVCESVFICETLSCFCVRVWCSIMTPCFFFSALYFPFLLFLVHLHSLVKTIHSQSSSVQGQYHLNLGGDDRGQHRALQGPDPVLAAHIVEQISTRSLRLRGGGGLAIAR